MTAQEFLKMDRNPLLGLSATLVVVAAELNSAGLEYKDAVNHLTPPGWTPRPP